MERTGATGGRATHTGNEPPVVLHVIPNLHTGGAETMLMTVQTRIAEWGAYQPFICGMKQGGTLQPLLEERGIPVRVLGIPRARRVTHDEYDAVTCALTAWLHLEGATEVMGPGLPVPLVLPERRRAASEPRR